MPQNQKLHRGIVYAVLMLDDLVHTNEHPFCNDPTCPCAQDHTLIREYLLDPLTDGLLTENEAIALYKNRQVS